MIGYQLANSVAAMLWPAQAIKARRVKTVGLDRNDESAVAKPCAPNEGDSTEGEV